MKRFILIFSFLFLSFLSAGSASASYSTVTNMDAYGDGEYEFTYLFAGNDTLAEQQLIQYFSVDEPASVDRMSYYIPRKSGANITNYTIVLFKAYNKTDHDTIESHRLNVSVCTDTSIGSHTIEYPQSIELDPKYTYGIHILVDSDGDYTNHEGTGINATDCVYFQSDKDSDAAFPMQRYGWTGVGAMSNEAWLADDSVLNITFFKNNSVIHANGLTSYSPTYSDVHQWRLSPVLDRQCDTSFTLNGEYQKWANGTSSPSVVFNDTDPHFNALGENSVSITAYDTVSSDSLSTIIYINQTGALIETVAVPEITPSIEIDTNGVTWMYSGGNVYNSTDETDDFLTRTQITNSSGLPAFGSTRILFYDNNTQFASNYGINGNVWKSADAGANFVRVLDEDYLSWKLLKDPSGAIYASTYSLTSDKAYIWKSQNLGVDWVNMFAAGSGARHIHQIGFVGSKLFALTGDLDRSANNSSVGLWKSLDMGESWVQDVYPPYQLTCVANVSGNGVFGADSDKFGFFLREDGHGGYSTTLLNTMFHQPAYDIKYDSIGDVVYAFEADDFHPTYPHGVVASPDRGRTWYYLANLTEKTNHVSELSAGGYYYIMHDMNTTDRFHTVANNLVDTYPNMVDIFADHGLMSYNATTTIYSLDNAYTKCEIYLNKNRNFKINFNHFPANITPEAGDTRIYTDQIVGESNQIYSNGTVSTVLQNSTSYDVKLFEIIPTDEITVNVDTWGPNCKIWNESSTAPECESRHIIGGFPANTDIQIKRDDINYKTVTSNETGYIEWVYDGGFSEHTFSIECHDFNASLTSGAYPLTTQFTTSSDGIDAYYWDFENDGIIDSTKQNPAHTYGKAGTYTVNLTVQNEYGNFSTVKTDYIVVSAPAFASDPLAWFNWVFSYLRSIYVSLWVAA